VDGYTKAETDVYSQTVREVTPDGYTLSWESKKSGRQAVRTYTKDWNPVIRGEGMAHSPYYPYLKFPLTVAKTWTEDLPYKQDSDEGRGNTRLKERSLDSIRSRFRRVNSMRTKFQVMRPKPASVQALEVGAVGGRKLYGMHQRQQP
jgi:hypothetical protein